ncbi:uncharacterized protein [Anabrus simplex]|uniref:uncharacterized protein n=1 Tax=Anabrus simplex TaxID=316456 RepID=UPI0035A3A585
MSLLLVGVLLITANIAVARKIPTGTNVDVFSLEVCTQYGQTCDETCKHLGLCLDTGNGFEFQQTMTCGDGLYCDSETHRCVKKEESSCVANKEEVICGTLGIFPDPYDCTKQLECTVVGLNASRGEACPAGMKFDPCTSQCDIDSSGDLTCNKVPPLCQYAGQVKRIPENHRLYYFCAENEDHLLRPVINRCPEGFFNVQTDQCTKSTVSGCVDPNGGENE